MPDIPIGTLAIMVLLIVDIVSGTEDDMVVNMSMVGMRCNDIGVLTLQKSVCKLLTYLMSFLRTDLAGGKRLYQMKSLIRVGLISMRQDEFEIFCSCFRRCSIGADEDRTVCFIRISNIFYCSRYGCLDTMDFCNCHSFSISFLISSIST